MWDLLERHENFEILARLVKIAETLPTSSSPLEQSFSVIKLLKTDIRNSISEESLEGLILIGDQYRDTGKIFVTEKMIDLYEKVRLVFNEKKKGKKSNDNMLIEVGDNSEPLQNQFTNYQMVVELSQ